MTTTPSTRPAPSPLTSRGPRRFVVTTGVRAGVAPGPGGTGTLDRVIASVEAGLTRAHDPTFAD